METSENKPVDGVQENKEQVAATNPESAINQEEVAAAITKWCRDEKWKKIFHEAPEGAKSRIALNFWVTENHTKPDFRRDVYLALRESLEKNLSEEDLEYLILTAPSEGAKGHFRQMLVKVSGASGDDGTVNAKGVENA